MVIHVHDTFRITEELDELLTSGVGSEEFTEIGFRVATCSTFML